jgi:hypothetical protein
MIPRAANLGSRPARNIGETVFGQRADSNFEEIIDKRGVLVDVKYNKVKCRACGEVGKIYNGENDLKICMACFVIQNSGVPEGIKEDPKEKKNEMGRFRTALQKD